MEALDGLECIQTSHILLSTASLIKR